MEYYACIAKIISSNYFEYNDNIKKHHNREPSASIDWSIIYELNDIQQRINQAINENPSYSYRPQKLEYAAVFLNEQDLENYLKKLVTLNHEAGLKLLIGIGYAADKIFELTFEGLNLGCEVVERTIGDGWYGARHQVNPFSKEKLNSIREDYDIDSNSWSFTSDEFITSRSIFGNKRRLNIK